MHDRDQRMHDVDEVTRDIHERANARVMNTFWVVSMIANDSRATASVIVHHVIVENISEIRNV